MYSLLYKFYFSLRRTQRNHSDSKDAFYRFSTFLIGYIEAYYNLYVVKQFQSKPSHKKGITDKKREQRIIVSLTSFPARIGTAWIAIETLLRQSVKPDEIILWLAKEQFPNENDLPIELIKQRERGLTVCFCDDLMSHKKYFYVMQEYPDDLVILVDDDTFYSKDMIKRLLELHNENPEDIVCMTPKIIFPDFESFPSEWRDPEPKERIKHSYYAQPYSGQGTLYPAHVIPKEAFQERLIKEICPYADDLWLKFMSLTTATRTTAIYPYRSIPVTIYGTGKSSLWYINGEKGQNDEQWQRILNHYPKELEKIKRLKA